MSTRNPWTATGPVCGKGHDLSALRSFVRAKNGARYCVICRRPPSAASRKRAAATADRRYRDEAQASAVAASIRATTAADGSGMSNERRVFATNDVETRSYGAALHLACLGHEVIGIRSRDNSNPYIRFKPDARPALENYYRQRDRLNTALERAMKPAEAALSAPEIEAKPLVRFRRGTELSAV